MAAVPTLVAPASGRHAFLSTTTWTPGGGVTAADTVCQADAGAAGLANPLNYRAMLTTTVPATDSTRISISGQPWYRLDGAQLVAAAADIADPTGSKTLCSPNVSSTGAYVSSGAWTGSGVAASSTAMTQNCNNWASGSPTVLGWSGSTNSALQFWWAGAANLAVRERLPPILLREMSAESRMALILLALIGNVFAPNVVRAAPVAPVRSPLNESDFVRDFRVSYYLELAVTLQALAPQERARRLRAMARDSTRMHEVFPLCRMLFEAKRGGVFRRPMIGEAIFAAGTYQDWPLEPIVLSDGLPFLVVRAYALAGKPESAAQYLAYCFASCQWSQRRYTAATSGQVAQALERLMSTNPALRAQADWLRRQTD